MYSDSALTQKGETMATTNLTVPIILNWKDIEAYMAQNDIVEVVRCKDCKHLFDGEHNANCCEVLMRKAKWLTEIAVDMNWHCADGERRTDG